MGFWHDHGAAVLSGFFKRQHNGDVKLFNSRVDRIERLFYNRQKEQTFYLLRGEKGMTIRHFGIILIENDLKKGDSYET